MFAADGLSKRTISFGLSESKQRAEIHAFNSGEPTTCVPCLIIPQMPDAFWPGCVPSVPGLSFCPPAGPHHGKRCGLGAAARRRWGAQQRPQSFPLPGRLLPHCELRFASLWLRRPCSGLRGANEYARYCHHRRGRRFGGHCRSRSRYRFGPPFPSSARRTSSDRSCRHDLVRLLHWRQPWRGVRSK